MSSPPLAAELGETVPRVTLQPFCSVRAVMHIMYSAYRKSHSHSRLRSKTHGEKKKTQNNENTDRFHGRVRVYMSS